MLRSLHIENYILIDSLDIDFPEGLIIITGQTGAGKSILLGALSLLTGGKADASVIGSASDNCVVEAEFDVEDKDLDFDSEDIDADGGHIIIRRVVNRSGRSRCFVNDSPVQATFLSDLATRLVDIHSQHRSLLLTDRKFQLSMLDNFASCANLSAECASIWKTLAGKRKALEEAREKLKTVLADADYHQARLKELEAAGLRDGELEELEDEQKRLANAEEIKENLAAAMNLLCSDEAPLSAALKEAEKILSKVSALVPSLQGLPDRLSSVRIETEDICDEIGTADSKIDLSGERLRAVEERLSDIYSLLKKHRCSTIAELLQVRDNLAGMLSDNSLLEEEIDTLSAEVDAFGTRHSELCRKLHAERTKASAGFAAEISASLKFLELEKAAFEVGISECEPGASGADTVCFKFSSTGGTAIDIAKCASGGELSRIMLSLKGMMARFSGMPTMIFDEIDTGVSGSVADKMGSMICRMGDHMQVIAITHLPQVAAKGNAHFVVTKAVDGEGRTISRLSAVDGESRVTEIARLLSGAEITPQAIENAKVLLAGN